jgi:hypothetical protein
VADALVSMITIVSTGAGRAIDPNLAYYDRRTPVS